MSQDNQNPNLNIPIDERPIGITSGNIKPVILTNTVSNNNSNVELNADQILKSQQNIVNEDYIKKIESQRTEISELTQELESVQKELHNVEEIIPTLRDEASEFRTNIEDINLPQKGIPRLNENFQQFQQLQLQQDFEQVNQSLEAMPPALNNASEASNGLIGALQGVGKVALAIATTPIGVLNLSALNMMQSFNKATQSIGKLAFATEATLIATILPNILRGATLAKEGLESLNEVNIGKLGLEINNVDSSIFELTKRFRGFGKQFVLDIEHSKALIQETVSEALKLRDVSDYITTLRSATQGIGSETVSDNLRQISSAIDYTKSAAELATPVYDLLSAGMGNLGDNFEATTGRIITQINKYSELTKAPQEGLQKAVIYILKAYNQGASEISSLLGELDMMIQKGIVQTRDIENMAKVFSTAAVIGIERTEVMAAMAQLTTKMNPYEAITALRSLLLTFVNKNPLMVKALKELNVELDLANKGIIGTVLEINEAAKGNVEIIKQIARESQSFLGFSSLIQTSRNELASLQADFKSASESGTDFLDERWDDYVNRIDVKSNIIKNKYNDLMGRIGQEFLSSNMFTKGLNHIDGLLNTFINNPFFTQIIKIIVNINLGLEKFTNVVQVVIKAIAPLLSILTTLILYARGGEFISGFTQGFKKAAATGNVFRQVLSGISNGLKNVVAGKGMMFGLRLFLNPADLQKNATSAKVLHPFNIIKSSLLGTINLMDNLTHRMTSLGGFLTRNIFGLFKGQSSILENTTDHLKQLITLTKDWNKVLKQSLGWGSQIGRLFNIGHYFKAATIDAKKLWHRLKSIQNINWGNNISKQLMGLSGVTRQEEANLKQLVKTPKNLTKNIPVQISRFQRQELPMLGTMIDKVKGSEITAQGQGIGDTITDKLSNLKQSLAALSHSHQNRKAFQQTLNEGRKNYQLTLDTIKQSTLDLENQLTPAFTNLATNVKTLVQSTEGFKLARANFKEFASEDQINKFTQSTYNAEKALLNFQSKLKGVASGKYAASEILPDFQNLQKNLNAINKQYNQEAYTQKARLEALKQQQFKDVQLAQQQNQPDFVQNELQAKLYKTQSEINNLSAYEKLNIPIDSELQNIDSLTKQYTELLTIQDTLQKSSIDNNLNQITAANQAQDSLEKQKIKLTAIKQALQDEANAIRNNENLKSKTKRQNLALYDREIERVNALIEQTSNLEAKVKTGKFNEVVKAVGTNLDNVLTKMQGVNSGFLSLKGLIGEQIGNILGTDNVKNQIASLNNLIGKTKEFISQINTAKATPIFSEEQKIADNERKSDSLTQITESSQKLQDLKKEKQVLDTTRQDLINQEKQAKQDYSQAKQTYKAEESFKAQLENRRIQAILSAKNQPGATDYDIERVEKKYNKKIEESNKRLAAKKQSLDAKAVPLQEARDNLTQHDNITKAYQERIKLQQQEIKNQTEQLKLDDKTVQSKQRLQKISEKIANAQNALFDKAKQQNEQELILEKTKTIDNRNKIKELEAKKSNLDQQEQQLKQNKSDAGKELAKTQQELQSKQQALTVAKKLPLYPQSGIQMLEDDVKQIEKSRDTAEEAYNTASEKVSKNINQRQKLTQEISQEKALTGTPEATQQTKEYKKFLKFKGEALAEIRAMEQSGELENIKKTDQQAYENIQKLKQSLTEGELSSAEKLKQHYSDVAQSTKAAQQNILKMQESAHQLVGDRLDNIYDKQVTAIKDNIDKLPQNINALQTPADVENLSQGLQKIGEHADSLQQRMLDVRDSIQTLSPDALPDEQKALVDKMESLTQLQEKLADIRTKIDNGTATQKDLDDLKKLATTIEEDTKAFKAKAKALSDVKSEAQAVVKSMNILSRWKIAQNSPIFNTIDSIGNAIKTKIGGYIGDVKNDMANAITSLATGQGIMGKVTPALGMLGRGVAAFGTLGLSELLTLKSEQETVKQERDAEGNVINKTVKERVSLYQRLGGVLGKMFGMLKSFVVPMIVMKGVSILLDGFNRLVPVFGNLASQRRKFNLEMVKANENVLAPMNYQYKKLAESSKEVNKQQSELVAFGPKLGKSVQILTGIGKAFGTILQHNFGVKSLFDKLGDAFKGQSWAKPFDYLFGGILRSTQRLGRGITNAADNASDYIERKLVEWDKKIRNQTIQALRVLGQEIDILGDRTERVLKKINKLDYSTLKEEFKDYQQSLATTLDKLEEEQTKRTSIYTQQKIFKEQNKEDLNNEIKKQTVRVEEAQKEAEAQKSDTENNFQTKDINLQLYKIKAYEEAKKELDRLATQRFDPENIFTTEDINAALEYHNKNLKNIQHQINVSIKNQNRLNDLKKLGANITKEQIESHHTEELALEKEKAAIQDKIQGLRNQALELKQYEESIKELKDTVTRITQDKIYITQLEQELDNIFLMEYDNYSDGLYDRRKIIDETIEKLSSQKINKAKQEIERFKLAANDPDASKEEKEVANKKLQAAEKELDSIKQNIAARKKYTQEYRSFVDQFVLSTKNGIELLKSQRYEQKALNSELEKNIDLLKAKQAIESAQNNDESILNGLKESKSLDELRTNLTALQSAKDVKTGKQLFEYDQQLAQSNALAIIDNLGYVQNQLISQAEKSDNITFSKKANEITTGLTQVGKAIALLQSEDGTPEEKQGYQIQAKEAITQLIESIDDGIEQFPELYKIREALETELIDFQMVALDENQKLITRKINLTAENIKQTYGVNAEELSSLQKEQLKKISFTDEYGKNTNLYESLYSENSKLQKNKENLSPQAFQKSFDSRLEQNIKSYQETELNELLENETKSLETYLNAQDELDKIKEEVDKKGKNGLTLQDLLNKDKAEFNKALSSYTADLLAMETLTQEEADEIIESITKLYHSPTKAFQNHLASISESNQGMSLEQGEQYINYFKNIFLDENGQIKDKGALESILVEYDIQAQEIIRQMYEKLTSYNEIQSSEVFDSLFNSGEVVNELDKKLELISQESERVINTIEKGIQNLTESTAVITREIDEQITNTLENSALNKQKELVQKELEFNQKALNEIAQTLGVTSAKYQEKLTEREEIYRKGAEQIISTLQQEEEKIITHLNNVIELEARKSSYSDDILPDELNQTKTLEIEKKRLSIAHQKEKLEIQNQILKHQTLLNSKKELITQKGLTSEAKRTLSLAIKGHQLNINQLNLRKQELSSIQRLENLSLEREIAYNKTSLAYRLKQVEAKKDELEITKELNQNKQQQDKLEDRNEFNADSDKTVEGYYENLKRLADSQKEFTQLEYERQKRLTEQLERKQLIEKNLLELKIAQTELSDKQLVNEQLLAANESYKTYQDQMVKTAAVLADNQATDAEKTAAQTELDLATSQYQIALDSLEISRQIRDRNIEGNEYQRLLLADSQRLTELQQKEALEISRLLNMNYSPRREALEMERIQDKYKELYKRGLRDSLKNESARQSSTDMLEADKIQPKNWSIEFTDKNGNTQIIDQTGVKSSSQNNSLDSPNLPLNNNLSSRTIPDIAIKPQSEYEPHNFVTKDIPQNESFTNADLTRTQKDILTADNEMFKYAKQNILNQSGSNNVNAALLGDIRKMLSSNNPPQPLKSVDISPSDKTIPTANNTTTNNSENKNIELNVTNNITVSEKDSPVKIEEQIATNIYSVLEDLLDDVQRNA
jgi:hypothetical protein